MRRRHGIGMRRGMQEAPAEIAHGEGQWPQNLAQREREAVCGTHRNEYHMVGPHRISRSATVPGLKRCGFLTPADVGADMRAFCEARAFRGALPPVDLRAVCFVRAIHLSPKPEF